MPRTRQESPQYIFKFRDNSVVTLPLDDAAVQNIVKKVNTILTCRAMGSSSGFIMLDDNSFSFSPDDLLYIRKKKVAVRRSARDLRNEWLNARMSEGRDEYDED